MPLVRRHLDRCRQDRHVMCATIGVGLYSTLATAFMGYSVLLSL